MGPEMLSNDTITRELISADILSKRSDRLYN